MHECLVFSSVCRGLLNVMLAQGALIRTLTLCSNLEVSQVIEEQKFLCPKANLQLADKWQCWAWMFLRKTVFILPHKWWTEYYMEYPLLLRVIVEICSSYVPLFQNNIIKYRQSAIGLSGWLKSSAKHSFGPNINVFLNTTFAAVHCSSCRK